MTDNRAWRGTSTIAVYGRRAVKEALAAHRNGALEVQLIRVARTLPKSVRQAAAEDARSLGVAFETASLHEVAALSRDPRNDQGVAARVRLLRVTDVASFVATLTGARAARPSRVIATDGITNPQNIGMIVRAASAAGFDAILWPRLGCPWVNGLVVKASASTALSATIVTCETVAEGLAELRRAGFCALALDVSGAQSVWQLDVAHRAVFVVGGEIEGLSQPVRDVIDGAVSIPMAPGVESLNAAIAAAVLCFAVTRGATSQAGGAQIP